MGCTLRMEIQGESEERVFVAAREAVRRMRALEHALSDYDPESESERLARAGPGLHAVSPDLFTLLTAGKALARRSEGAFDVSCGALSRLWRGARRAGVPPSTEAQRAAHACTGSGNISLEANPPRAGLGDRGTCLDFGGIAKGHAVSEGARVLQRAGLPVHLVALDGDLALGAPPDHARGWLVSLNPVPGSSAMPVLELSHVAVSTSGDAFQSLQTNTKRFSHILDPRTGEPVTQRVAVTVLAQDGLIADSAATALCVAKPKERAAMARRFGVAARVVDGAAKDARVELVGPWPIQSHN
jgi:thiamine biosynthesis lipoprotein